MAARGSPSANYKGWLVLLFTGLQIWGWGFAYHVLLSGPVEKACQGQDRKGGEEVDRKQQPPDEELVPPRLANQLIADEGSQNRRDQLDANKESRCCRSLFQAECIVQYQGHARSSQEESAQALITTGHRDGRREGMPTI